MDTIKGQVNLIFGAFEFDRVPEDDRVRMMQIAEQAGIGGIDCGVIYVSSRRSRGFAILICSTERCSAITGKIRCSRAF
jgi:hypothetical protein